MGRKSLRGLTVPHPNLRAEDVTPALNKPTVTGVGSGGMQGSDTPTIYVGDIDMYIPLDKPNT